MNFTQRVSESVRTGDVDFFEERNFQCAKSPNGALTCKMEESGDVFITDDSVHIREGLTYWNSEILGPGMKWVGKISVDGRQILARVFDTDANGKLDADGGGWLEILEIGEGNRVSSAKHFVGVKKYFSKVFDKTDYSDDSPPATSGEMEKYVNAANAAYQQGLRAAGF